MHDMLKPYAMEEFAYLPKDELINLLKKTDIAYFLDDLNYLTVPTCHDALCGYIPGTDPARNFSYLIYREIPPEVQAEMETKLEPWVDKELYISCRDPEVLEQFLDIHYKNRIHTRLCLNTPVQLGDQGKNVQETVETLLAKYNGYYRLDPKCSPVYDYRYAEPGEITMPEKNPVYRIENRTFGTLPDELLLYCWVLYKQDEECFCTLLNTANYVSVGIKCISFSDDIRNSAERKAEAEDVLYLWKYLAAKFHEDGYLIKSIALNIGFDSDEMYEIMGMTKYRCFTTVITEDYIPKKG